MGDTYRILNFQNLFRKKQIVIIFIKLFFKIFKRKFFKKLRFNKSEFDKKVILIQQFFKTYMNNIKLIKMKKSIGIIYTQYKAYKFKMKRKKAILIQKIYKAQ